MVKKIQVLVPKCLKRTIKLFDTNGKEIKTLFQGDFTKSLDNFYSVKGISLEIYIIKIETEIQSISKKLMVQ